jgi:hypothetical protein
LLYQLSYRTIIVHPAFAEEQISLAAGGPFRSLGQMMEITQTVPCRAAKIGENLNLPKGLLPYNKLKIR